MPQQFLHISDPHLSSLEDVKTKGMPLKRRMGYLSWQRKRQHEHRTEVLDALCQDLAEQTSELLLLTGDLTHIGLPNEFQQASQWLQKISQYQELALVPGNHDACVYDNWNQTFGLWLEYMSTDQTDGTLVEDNRELYPSLRVRGDIAFIGLSTACPTLPAMASGTLGKAQLKRLRALLDDSGKRGLCRVIFMHHCPVAGADKWRKRLTDAKAFSELIAECGAELILHGHGHRAQNHQLPGKSGSVPVVAVPSASALGRHGGDRAAYNCYGIERVAQGWELSTRIHQYQPATQSFQLVEETSVIIARA